MRVLIVDDHAPFRASAGALLSSGGMEVVGEAEDVESAVEAARELDPEVVLVDVHLRDADGFELTRVLVAEHPELRVVLISSREVRSVEPRLRDSGAVGFLTKVDLSAHSLRALLAAGAA